MSRAYSIAKCMFFVGGNAAKASNDAAGISLAGGCTKDWWDTEVAATDAETAMGKLMGADGSAIYSIATATVLQIDFTTIEISNITTDGIEAGMLVYIDMPVTADVYRIETADVGKVTVLGSINYTNLSITATAGNANMVMSSGNPVEGEIIEFTSSLPGGFSSNTPYYIVYVAGTTIQLSATKGGAAITPTTSPVSNARHYLTLTNMPVHVGGACGSLDTVADLIDADNYSQEIWVNKDYSLSAELDTTNWGEGNKAKNTWMKIAGFNRTPYDMHKGGVYYQDCWNKYVNGVNDTAAFKLDWDGNNVHGLAIDGLENVIFDNMYTLGVSNVSGDGKQVMPFRNSPSNIFFNNCVSAGRVPFGSLDGIGSNIQFIDCYSIPRLSTGNGGNGFTLFTGSTGNFVDCLVNNATAGINYATNGADSVLVSCIGVNGYRGLQARTNGNNHLVVNCTFYNISLSGIQSGGGSTIVALNTIHLLTDATGVVYDVHTGGASYYDDYNCGWSLAGELTNYGEDYGSGVEQPLPGFNSLEVDPQLIDAAGGNFTPQNKTVLLGGMIGPGGARGHIGGVGQEWQFVARSRAGNAGRLGIYK